MNEEVVIYDIIYADPPWSYYNDMTVSPDCTTVRGVRRPPYPVMSSKDIEAMPVSKIANKDAVLLIWTTDYHLSKCLDVIIRVLLLRLICYNQCKS